MLMGIFALSPLLLADHHHDECHDFDSCPLCHFITASADRNPACAEMHSILLLGPAPHPADQAVTITRENNTHGQRAPPLSS
jgi:hypothetical protein